MVVELLTAIFFALVIFVFGVTLEALKFLVLTFLLLGLIFTDLDCKLLPDEFTLIGLALGIVFSLFVPVESFVSLFVPPAWWAHLPPDLAWREQSLLDSISGALFGSMMIYGAGYAYLKFRGVEGMGFGDVKMMAMIGAFLGIQMTLFTIGAAAIAASLFGAGTIVVVWIKRFRRRHSRGHEPATAALRRAWQSASLIYRSYEIPFGTFLGAMGLIAFLFGADLLRWYMHRWSLHIY
jgi:leader peptidase (prepilin peptidase)/N-methyltransferase